MSRDDTVDTTFSSKRAERYGPKRGDQWTPEEMLRYAETVDVPALRQDHPDREIRAFVILVAEGSDFFTVCTRAANATSIESRSMLAQALHDECAR